MKDKGHTSQDVVSLLSETIGFVQRPKCIHTDSGGIFVPPANAKNPEEHPLHKYLSSEGITHSVVNQSVKKHGNNVHERLNGSLKTRIKDALLGGFYKTSKGQTWRRTPEGKAWLKKGWRHNWNALTNEEAEAILHIAVTDYNSKHHRMLGTSPIIQANALAAEAEGILAPNNTTPQLAASNSAFGKELIKKRAEATTNYKED